METLEEIKKALKENKVIIGYRQTVKYAKKNGLSKIIYAKNAPKELVDSLLSLGGVEIVRFEGDSESLAIACGKPFNIAVLGILR